jgi:hypothetical protein
MNHSPSSVFVSTWVLVVLFVLTANHTGQALAASNAKMAEQPGVGVAPDDLVTLARGSGSVRGFCTGELGLPTERVFPDGSRELFVVPPGYAFVLTDIEGEITKNVNAAWPVGAIAYLTATLTGAVANQQVRARAPIDADAVSAGIVTTKLHLQSGVVADTGAHVCLRATAVYSTGISSAHVGNDIRLHGYLMPR